MAERELAPATFKALRIGLASPEQILSWSHGEVTKPETINYRTLRPEKEGLFDERIFGPTKDWECFCGKYKRIRYRGVICDRCGVEVTRAKVRRERMGHIKLAAPVVHIWFSKGTPSRLGLLLDLSPRNLERILYFAQHVIISVDEEARQHTIADEEKKHQQEVTKRGKAAEESTRHLRQQFEAMASSGNGAEAEKQAQAIEAEIKKVQESLKEELTRLEEELQARKDELEDIRPRKLLTEVRYRELKERYGDVFKAGMGAEAILEILKSVGLEALAEELRQEMNTTSGQRRRKAIKRLRVVEAFRRSQNKPEWMIRTVVPVLPPELRPMVQLDGGRFATSDLNDLYRRVINRNNRLRRLLELGAPEIIVRNEKRMLQEAVDALIDNGRRGRPIQGSHNHKLKSLSDLLRGKQGRFRQNLLGKRVDYSGRSVIVVGPELELHQCGLPKRMALELFKPFVMHKLVLLGLAPNIKSAKRIVERARPEVWDMLEEVVKERLVLLNRAPTLHRLGIQAFQPILIEGNAIQIHPLVCSAFNADFDGDQMAVHVPLSRMAMQEAKRLMLSKYNMLSPASGEPLVAPTLDIVMGCYYLTDVKQGAKGEGQKLLDFDDAMFAYEAGLVDLQAAILVRNPNQPDGWLNTSVGRIIFNKMLPPVLGYKNMLMDKKMLKELTAEACRVLGNDGTAEMLDRIKGLGFHYATTSGITIGIQDIQVSPEKQGIIDEATKKVEELEEQYNMGLITEEERYSKAVEIWMQASDKMTKIVERDMPTYGGIAIMALSGAKGNLAQIKQMAGMKGLVSNPKGRIIDLPIKSSFREGLTALEYFISTHGARKGLADTALRTADSGYLTRRLVDVCQDVIVLEQDCGTTAGIEIVDMPNEPLVAPFKERVWGRFAAAPVKQPKTGKTIVDKNEEIDEEKAKTIVEAGITSVFARSPLTCEARRGVCSMCYGRVLATGKNGLIGEAVGIIAAQSIGEPGTQLTMRTFHTGGVYLGVDITSGLPRVEELFEARVPKGSAVMAEIDGVVEIEEQGETKVLRVISREEFREEHKLLKSAEILVSNGQKIEVATVLARLPRAKGSKEASGEIVAETGGRVEVHRDRLIIVSEEVDTREYVVPAVQHILVKNGEQVRASQALTNGPFNPHDILRIKGRDEVQRYLIDEVQKVYRSQGVSIHDKHIEVIIRQMLRRVQVEDQGDTEFIPNEYVTKVGFQETNAKVLAEGGQPATARPALLGVTRASLLTDSFLAAASFQETTRVLTEAAVRGAKDNLLGLKENVIIGRLIPARIESTPEGRERLALSALDEQPKLLEPSLTTTQAQNGHESDGASEEPPQREGEADEE